MLAMLLLPVLSRSLWSAANCRQSQTLTVGRVCGTNRSGES